MNFLKPTNKTPLTVKKYRTLMYCWDVADVADGFMKTMADRGFVPAVLEKNLVFYNKETKECVEFCSKDDLLILEDGKEEELEESSPVIEPAQEEEAVVEKEISQKGKEKMEEDTAAQ